MFSKSPLFALIALAALIPAATVCANADKISAGSLNISHPWARPTLGNVKISAAYMTIINNGSEGDTLVSVSSEIAERTEIHETTIVDDMARMQQVEGGVLVPAQKSAHFKPLGKHIMLIGLNRKLKAGDTFPLKLVFKNQGDVTIDVPVEEPRSGAKPKSTKGSHSGSHQ